MLSRARTQITQIGSSVTDWMEDRTGIVSMTETFLYEPVPKRGKWLYTLGSATLFLITVQFLTGILLLFYYVPTTEDAWNSIFAIMNETLFGQLIRGMHFWSANALMIVIGLHMMRTFFSAAYKAPREMNWIVGVMLIFLVTILAFTGYALRWDQEGFWAWEVGVKIGSYTPVIGSLLANFLLGGDTAGPATLSRLFALHVWLLPAVLAPLIGIHLFLLRKHGEFGGDFEYSQRMGELRRQQQMEEYLEEEEDRESP